MNMQPTCPPRAALRQWSLVVRAYSFPISAAPVALAAVMVWKSGVPAQWWYLPLLLLSALCLHGGANVINDYYDFRNGVDTAGASSTWALARGLVSEPCALLLGRALLLLAPLAALPVLIARGPVLLGMGLAGTAGCYFYTAPPLGLKYRGLGEAIVFPLTGPLLTAAAAYGLTGRLTVLSLLCGVPPGCLATAVLFGNNLRDMDGDSSAGVRTLASRLGPGAAWGYPLLITAAYLGLAPLAAMGALGLFGALLPAAAIPFFAPLVRSVLRRDSEAMRGIDVKTARGYAVFCGLFAAGLAMS